MESATAADQGGSAAVLGLCVYIRYQRVASVLQNAASASPRVLFDVSAFGIGMLSSEGSASDIFVCNLDTDSNVISGSELDRENAQNRRKA
jgi:hypothetical protein